MPNTRQHFLANLIGTKQQRFETLNFRLQETGANPNRLQLLDTGGGTPGVFDAPNVLQVGDMVVRKSGTPKTFFLQCNGQAVSRSTYNLLFAEIGTTYGAGNGTTTFNLPNIAAPGANLAYFIFAGQ